LKIVVNWVKELAVERVVLGGCSGERDGIDAGDKREGVPLL
jgi:hypothetical protein